MVRNETVALVIMPNDGGQGSALLGTDMCIAFKVNMGTYHGAA